MWIYLIIIVITVGTNLFFFFLPAKFDASDPAFMLMINNPMFFVHAQLGHATCRCCYTRNILRTADDPLQQCQNYQNF